MGRPLFLRIKFLILLGIFGAWTANSGCDVSEQTAGDAASNQTPAPAVPSREGPPQQELDFLKIIDETRKDYSGETSTSARKENAPSERRQALTAFFDGAPVFADWEVQVVDVETKGSNLFASEKIAVLTVSPAPGVIMFNMDLNNYVTNLTNITSLIENLYVPGLSNITSLIEGFPENAVIEGTAMYDTVLRLSKGDRVAVSGRFILNSDQEPREASLTTAGGMSQPEFVVEFMEVEKIGPDFQRSGEDELALKRSRLASAQQF